MTAGLSELRLMTQLLIMKSTELSSTGNCSMWPLRNSTLLAPLRQHVVGHIHADDVPGGTYLSPRKESIETGAATQVEHGHARFQFGQGEWIAATQSEIGLTGDLQIFLRVSDGRGHPRRRT